MRATSRPPDAALEGRGLQMLGETSDFTYFVLSHDHGAALMTAIDNYTSRGQLGSLLDLVDDLEPYGPEDRRGPGLDPLPPDYPLRVDITIWASSTYHEAERRAAVVNGVLAAVGGQVELHSLGTHRNMIRARIIPTVLDDLLATSVIEQVRTPPVPFLDFRDWRELSAGELQRKHIASAVVGVLDDAPATGHPLLVDLVESIDSIALPSYPWQQPGNHGTEVVGRVLLPELHEQLRDSVPISAHGTVRVARILEPDPNRPDNPPRFVTSNFPHELVEQGIRRLHKDYGVKIFNLSIGYAEPFVDAHVGALTEAIDELVRELDIVVVVPTGNAPVHSSTGRTISGHHVADDYPAYLDSPEHRLSEPGPAALAVTVGAIALSDAGADIPGRHGWKAVAGVDHVSPFSRTGPGVGTNMKRRNKPELVHYGGNVVLNDVGLVVHNDPGAGIVSTALNPMTGQLFASCNGTSYAAPAVARVAADIAHAYPDASANLVRALLALGAKLPTPANNTQDEYRRAARFGLGRPDSERAISSGRRRATMTYDGAMPVDTVHIHPVPVPEVFRRGSGSARTITVTLAFDPPVRRQRREYLAAAMKLDLYRNIDPDELQDVLSRQDPEDPRDPIKDQKRHPKLHPGSDSLLSSTLQDRRWTAINSFVNDDETFYLAVTHRAATWARDDPAYESQAYALTVTLEDEQLQQADLRSLLTQQVRLPARVRLQS